MNINRCFEILEIPSNATYEDAKAAYRIMFQVWHPDKYNHSEQLHAKATSKIKEINAAWSQIEDYFKNDNSREAEARETERQAREERERSQQAEQDKKWREAAEQAKAEQEKQKQSNESRNESPGMIWDSEDDAFICVTCPKCNKGSKIKKTSAHKTITGYSLDGKGNCSCGYSFDKIEKNNTINNRNSSTFNQHLLQGLSDYLKRPWWMVILPVVALSLIKACNNTNSASSSNPNSYVPAQKPYVSELDKLIKNQNSYVREPTNSKPSYYIPPPITNYPESNDSYRPIQSSPQSPINDSNDNEYKYVSPSSGLKYKYDLSNPSDAIRYEVDPSAQLKDSINPRVELDRGLGYQGGGAEH